MFFYSFLKYYSIVCLDFFPWGGGFFDPLIDLSFPTLENLIKKFYNLSNPHPLPALTTPPPPPPTGAYIDRWIKFTSKAMKKARVTSPAIHLREKD